MLSRSFKIYSDYVWKQRKACARWPKDCEAGWWSWSSFLLLFLDIQKYTQELVWISTVIDKINIPGG